MKAGIFHLGLWGLPCIILSACGTPAPASSTPPGTGARQTIQVVAEVTARHRRVAYLREDFPVTRVFTWGTAWAIETSGRRLLVTAAHVVGVGERPPPVHFEEMQNGKIVARNPINLGELKERDFSYRVRIGLGELGSAVATIGTTPDLPDGVFLEPADSRIWRELRPTALATKNLVKQEEVTVLGYPSTFSEQPTNALVAEIYPGYFVLNQELDPGYSGGLVTNRSGEAVGVVASVTKKQTTVFFITQHTLSGASFRPASELLVKNAEKLPP
ncbi:MAG: trypsin-like peptidase domain-containing protein [Verrucomicrobia bacterium]|nr:trypsin-like peptidase domain-containing protein [Verrucomicrobiota bacterium]